MVIFWRSGVYQKTHILITFALLGVPGVALGAGGHANPLGHPGPAQTQPGQNGPRSRLDAPNGEFKVPKAGHRRLQV